MNRRKTAARHTLIPYNAWYLVFWCNTHKGGKENEDMCGEFRSRGLNDRSMCKCTYVQ